MTKSFDATSGERLSTILRCAVQHLHAFVLGTGLTREEWAAGVAFLTQTGQRCDERRQEFILLSDTLGVSMLVEMVNQRASDAATEPTVLGPFYVADAPAKAMGDSIAAGPEGTPLTISGVVRSLDGAALDGAQLEVWQTAPNGRYDVQDSTLEPMSNRGTAEPDPTEPTRFERRARSTTRSRSTDRSERCSRSLVEARGAPPTSTSSCAARAVER